MISLIVPTFNNHKSLESGLEDLTSHPSYNKYPIELIIVDDGSENHYKSELIAKKFDAIFIANENNLGKGAAISKGVKKASQAYILFTDSDMPFELDDIFMIIEKLINSKYDLVLGNRTHISSNNQKVSFTRKVCSASFLLISNFILNTKGFDNQCGLKGFKAEVAKKLFSKIVVNRFSFDAEVIYRAIKLNLSIINVPVRLRRNGKSSLNIFKDGSIMLIDLIRIKLFSLIYIKEHILFSKKSKFICDDYGLHPSINLAIEELAKNERVDGASIMATHCNKENCIKLKQYKKLEYGLHLNLTEGKAMHISSLTDSFGNFYGLNSLLKNLLFFKVKKNDIRKEIELQLEHFLNNFHKIDYIDGHQHIHYFPYIFNLLMNVLQDKNLSHIRIRNCIIKGSFFKPKNLILSFLATINRRKKSNSNIKYLLDYNQCLNSDEFETHDFEYMLHVAHPDIDGKDLNKTTFTWQNRVDQFNHKSRN